MSHETPPSGPRPSTAPCTSSPVEPSADVTAALDGITQPTPTHEDVETTEREISIDIAEPGASGFDVSVRTDASGRVVEFLGDIDFESYTWNRRDFNRARDTLAKCGIILASYRDSQPGEMNARGDFQEGSYDTGDDRVGITIPRDILNAALKDGRLSLSVDADDCAILE